MRNAQISLQLKLSIQTSMWRGQSDILEAEKVSEQRSLNTTTLNIGQYVSTAHCFECQELCALIIDPFYQSINRPLRRAFRNIMVWNDTIPSMLGSPSFSKKNSETPSISHIYHFYGYFEEALQFCVNWIGVFALLFGHENVRLHVHDHFSSVC